MYIHQITVFLENMKGTLSKLTTLLASKRIDILAMSIADTSGFGLVRLIVREADNEQCLALLKEAGYSARKNHVICVRVPNEPGGLNRVLCLLDADKFKADLKKQAADVAKQDAALDAYAEKKGLIATDKEVEAEFKNGDPQNWEKLYED